MYRWVRQHYQFQLRGRRFLEAPWSGGLVLLFSVAVAMLLANLPWTAEYYQRVLNIDIALVVRGPGSLIDWMFPRGLTLQTFVNDGLMVVFFFLIGLEIKREIVIGQLSSVRKAILPVLAALGGMVVPALIYFRSTREPSRHPAGESLRRRTLLSPSASFRYSAIGCLFRSKFS